MVELQQVQLLPYPTLLINYMAMDRYIWYDWHKQQVDEIKERNPWCIIMCKEKYWRFDISACWVENKFDQDYLWHLEENSVNRCQKCNKECHQYRTECWWIEHFCLKHYIVYLCSLYIRRFKFFIRRLWQKTK